MNWHDTSEFLAMGGYALYVWGSFGACALGMLLEPLRLRQQRRRLLGGLHARHAADAAFPIRSHA